MWSLFNEKLFTVYFTSPKIPFDDITEGGIEENLIRLINKAKKTVDVAVFEFNLVNVANALVDSHQRGVTVRVVYDNQFADPELINTLIKAGIQVFPDNRSAFMHNKFFIVDKKYVWTGSFNITINSAYRNHENAIIICDKFLAKNYTLEFEEMVAGKFGKKSPENTTEVMTLRGIKVENYFAPESEVMAHIIGLVETAKTYVHFLAFSFTDQRLAVALIAKVTQGVNVSGVFEKRGSSRKTSQFNRLYKKGADVRLDANPRTMHHKVIIIDGRIVIFGSYNFSSNASDVNDENLLIVHDPFLAGKYEAEFQKIFSKANKTKRGK